MHASRQDFDRNDAVAGVQQLGCVFCALLWCDAARSAGVVATVVNGMCPFSEPGASSDPGWCGVSGAFALAVRWGRFAVQGWHCSSGADVALVLILQHPIQLARRRSCGNQKLSQPVQPQRGAAFAGSTGTAVCALGDTDMRRRDLVCEAWVACTICQAFGGRNARAFAGGVWHLRGRKLRRRDSGRWG